MEAAGTLNRLISDVLAASPAAARAFFERGMACVGCPFAPFETVAEAAAAYGVDPCAFADAIGQFLTEGAERA